MISILFAVFFNITVISLRIYYVYVSFILTLMTYSVHISNIIYKYRNKNITSLGNNFRKVVI